MKKLKNENVGRRGGQVLYLPNSRSRRDNKGTGKSDIKRLRLAQKLLSLRQLPERPAVNIQEQMIS